MLGFTAYTMRQSVLPCPQDIVFGRLLWPCPVCRLSEPISGRASLPVPFQICFSDSSPPIGADLVKHTLQRAVTATRLIGGRTLTVHAINAEAADFRRQLGFLASKDRTISSSCFDRSQQLQPRSKRKRAEPNTVKACFRCSGHVVRTLRGSRQRQPSGKPPMRIRAVARQRTEVGGAPRSFNLRKIPIPLKKSV